MRKIIGIGNALVDVIVNIPDERILEKFSLPKGGMEMIDIDKKRKLHQTINSMQQTIASGGSTSNTIHGLAHLGAQTGYIGKVSRDEMGCFFEKDLQKSNICPHLIYTDNMDTGIATTLMTRDAERTFATYLGAAASMDVTDINRSIIANYDYIHVEGYLIFNKKLILHICQLAKEAGLKISMDMASYNLVKDHKEFIISLLKDYVDTVFANEEESKALTGLEPEESLDILSQYCPVAVIKLGSKGSIANIHGEKIKTKTNGKAPIDTNGAGDAYAAGFLFGLLNQFPAEKIGKLAARLGDEMVACIGAKLSDNQWDKILNEKDLF